MATKLNHCRQQIEALDADLSGSIFNDVNFAGTSITNANLSNLRITDANLTGAIFEDCNTTGMTINGILVSDLQAAYLATLK